MSLPKRFDRLLKNGSGFRAAFPPTLSALRVGSVVVRKDGIFQQFADLSDFGIKFKTVKTSTARISLESAGVSTRAFQGGVEVDVMKIAANANANIQIDMKQQNSFLLKTDRLQVTEMENEFAVAMAVRKVPEWRHQKFHIVNAVAVGRDVSFFGSTRKNGGVRLSGAGKAVFDFVTVGLSAGLSRTKKVNVAFDVFGGDGPVGIRVFRAKKNGQFVFV